MERVQWLREGGGGECKQQKWGVGRWVPKGKGHGLRVGMRAGCHMGSPQWFGGEFKTKHFENNISPLGWSQFLHCGAFGIE